MTNDYNLVLKKHEGVLSSSKTSPVQTIEENDASLFSSDVISSSSKELNVNDSNEAISSASIEFVKSMDDDKKEALKNLLMEQAQTIQKDLTSAKNSNGWISGMWDGVKNFANNFFTVKSSSNYTQGEVDKLIKQIEDIESDEDLLEAYKEITGSDLESEDDLLKLSNGEINVKETSKQGQLIDKYSEGQKMSTDVIADIASGVASVLVVGVGSAVGICAAPFTAGASLGLVAAGVGMAAATGAAVKTGLKASDCIGNEKEYSLNNLGYDLITGSINGAMGPVSNAAGGAIGTSIMKASGLTALETQVVKSTGKQVAIKVAATAADMAVDGALSGAADGFSRSLAEGDDLKEIATETAQGFAIGAVASPVIGGSMKLAGKAGSKIGNAVAQTPVGTAAKAVGGKIDDATNKLYNKLMDELGSLKIPSNLKKAKSAMLNVPTVENPDMEVLKEFSDIYKQASDLVDNFQLKGTSLFEAIDDDLFTIERGLSSAFDNISTINDELAGLSSQNKTLVIQILDDIANGQDVSKKMAELAKHGIDITTLVDDKVAKAAEEINEKLATVAAATDGYINKAQEANTLLNQTLQDGSAIAQHAIDEASKLPDTNMYKQLGDLPKKASELYQSLHKQVTDIDEIAQLASEKMQNGETEEAVELLQRYTVLLDELEKSADDSIASIQKAAQESGIQDSAQVIKNRLERLMSTEEFQNMPREKQIQAVIENTNILLSKFAQTFSSDSTMPPEISSILKQFTSNCTVSRTMDEAQAFANELYGDGKYTLIKTLKAGTIGETYLAQTQDGTKVVIKMLKDGVTPEKFAQDRALFTNYINEFVSDPAEKEYKLNLINSMFDAWDTELDYGLEAQGAKDLAQNAKRFKVAQTLEVGKTADGANVSLVMEQAKGVPLDDLLEMIKLYKENPQEYLTKYADTIKEFPALKTPEKWYDDLGVAYQKAQNEQAMFVSKTGTSTLHADPHSGNIFIDFDAKTGKPQINYIDTGNVIRRTNSQTLQDIALSLNMMIGNSEGIAQAMLKGATLPDGADINLITKQFSEMLDERLYKANINLKSTQYTQKVINDIMKELNVIPDTGNSNLMKATLQRIETSRAIYDVCGTSSNKIVDIADLGLGILKSLRVNPKETIATIKPILKWAKNNNDQAMLTFFQMIIKNVTQEAA